MGLGDYDDGRPVRIRLDEESRAILRGIEDALAAIAALLELLLSPPEPGGATTLVLTPGDPREN